MTMLDRMRRHRNWLKWSLALVVLAFVIFYIPDFLQQPTTDLAATDAVATIDGEQIRADEFRRSYQNQLAAYRQAYGNNLNDRLLKQLGIDRQILQQMVDERAASAEAERLDIRVSDDEVRQAILTFPAFQDNGAFIGEERYQQLLRMQNPPLTAAEFEESVRRGLVVQKLRTAVTDWLSIPDKEIDTEYRRRNDKVKMVVATFAHDNFRSQVNVSDADVSTRFESDKEAFRIPEKRKIKYLLVDMDELRKKIVIPPADVERTYNERIDQYSTPEEIRASHILLKTEGKDEAAVRARAEELLKQARSNADFADLARKHSEDEATAPLGGDLNFFGRGRMVPEFDAAAFNLEPNQISEIIKTPFGFHIIKVTEKKPAVVTPIDAVRPQITEELSFERAQAQAEELVAALEKQITRPDDLEPAAKARGLTVQESALFAVDEPILGLGPAAELATRVFSLGDNEVTAPIRTGRGFVVATLVEKKDAYVPMLEEVKERVRDTIAKERAAELAKQKAADLSARLKSSGNFEAAAKAAGATVETTELVTRDSPLPGLGVSTAITDAAFALGSGAVSEPIAGDTNTSVVKVLEKQEVTPAELTSNKDQFREELLSDRRNRFFAAYLNKVKEKMKIEVNRAAVQRLVG